MMSENANYPRSMLCVGHVCVDLINLCSHYPEEDAKVGTNSKNNRLVVGKFLVTIDYHSNFGRIFFLINFDALLIKLFCLSHK